MTQGGRRLILIGATGLIGRNLAARLLAAPAGPEIHALVRQPSGRSHPRWREHLAPADEWPALAEGIGAEAAVSTLGTTMRSAGSRAAFRAIDLEAVAAFASAVRRAGARQLVTVSSVGADAESGNFYLRTKGEMERALEALGFERLDVFRPGLLRGERGGDRRLGERIGIALSPLVNLVLRGRLDRFAAIDAGVVAAAMAAALRQAEPGIYRYENRTIRALARTL